MKKNESKRKNSISKFEDFDNKFKDFFKENITGFEYFFFAITLALLPKRIEIKALIGILVLIFYYAGFRLLSYQITAKGESLKDVSFKRLVLWILFALIAPLSFLIIILNHS